MFNECRHIMPSGAKCKAPALRERSFCYFHWRLRATGSAKGRPRKSLPRPSIEDPQGIQIALTGILGALGSPTCDNKRAGLYLYGLQIAAQLAARTSVPPTSDLVRSLANDAGPGENLAPETTQCDPGAECDACAAREECVLPARIAYLAARQFYAEALEKLGQREQREIERAKEFSPALAWASEPKWQDPSCPEEMVGD